MEKNNNFKSSSTSWGKWIAYILQVFLRSWKMMNILKYTNNIINSEKTLLNELYSLWEKYS